MAMENNSDSLPCSVEFFPFFLNPNNHVHPGKINVTDEPNLFLLQNGHRHCSDQRGKPAWRQWPAQDGWTDTGMDSQHSHSTPTP